LKTSEVSVIRYRLEIIASRLADSFGVPRRKRRMPDPLELLIATILSQNTNDINSHRAFTNLKNAFPKLLLLADVQPRKIESLIRVGGIAKKKSKTIVRIVREVKSNFEKFDSGSLRRIPRETLIQRLCTMKGVGYKTAECVSLFALGDNDAFPVDTHVHRVLNRLGIVKEKTPDKTYLRVKNFVPYRRGYDLHLNLIKFGRKICLAQNPKCYECYLLDLCGWEEKSLQAPRKESQVDKKKVEFMLLEKV